ncbi:hypothetical protein [Sorangium sp. So ce233]|uniref:hypothetical protein n=1 Tax=Sorangium sp. So ce233 TaxID=3133290 RepID=UPI003F6230B4
MNSITRLTSPNGFRARFELMARAGELSIIGEPIPEVAVETSRRGFGEMTRERAERVIARCARMGWSVISEVPDTVSGERARESRYLEATARIAERYERARKVLREARWYRHHDRLLFTACLITARRCRNDAREARKRLAAV